jgi:ketosteroid isomerase-like protein
MPKENVEIVRRHIDATNAFMRGELSSEAYAESLDPQCEVHWRDRQTYPDTPQDLRGVPEIVAFSEQFRAGWVDLSQEPLECIDAPDDRMLVLIRQGGRGRESGVPVEIHFFEVLTIRDRKVRKIEYFRHRADAMGAAGLSE